MKAKLFDKTGKEKGSVDLPKNFAVKIRADILAKAFDAQRGLHLQAYGSMEGAGAQYSASGISKKKRHDWKSTYGKGISRIPRKIMSRHGASFNWIGATASSTRGGRRPHAPRSQKVLVKKMNKKELAIAMNCALAGTVDQKSLEIKFGKGSIGGLVATKDVLTLKTKNFIELMKGIFGKNAKILKEKKIRAGIGKMRGRKYKSNAGMLFVLGNSEKMARKGIDVVKVKDLTIRDLAPNGEAGRLVCYSEAAIKDIEARFK